MNYVRGRKGFTLIELMIVISIIGILAVTIVPAIAGAPARARDAGRVSGIASTRAALEIYYGDYGKFPATSEGCLSDENGTVTDDNLEDIFSKGKAPVDPQKGNKSKPCATGGVLGYKVLEKNGTEDSSYLLVTNVETNAKANTNLTDAAASETTYEALKDVVGVIAEDNEFASDADSVYAELY